MNIKNIFKRHTGRAHRKASILLAAGIGAAFFLVSALPMFGQGKTIEDYRALKSNPVLAKRATQEGKVFHTNGTLWNSWDNLGNTGDISCSAIVPAFQYPGGTVFSYLCRGGYWVVAKSNTENGLVDAAGQTATYLEGTTGEYVLTRGTIPGPVSEGWANPNDNYSKEPWESRVEWQTSAGLKVVATRYASSFTGNTNNYFRIGPPTEFFDFNDFILEVIDITYDGDLDGDGTPDASAVPTLDQVVLGIKADHDCVWNTGPAGFLENFWDDDGVDYDEDTFSTFELDGDRASTSEDDTGIDDPVREWRGVHVGQTWVASPDVQLFANSQMLTFPGNTISHYWWTGENDPQSPAKRFAFSSSVFNAADEATSDNFTFDPTLSGDFKTVNPPVTDMRYLQAYGPWVINKGETVRVVTAALAGSGLESAKNASRAAKLAWAWNLNLPKPPPAPMMWADSLRVTSDLKVRVYWDNPNEDAADPDLGRADFAGYRIYRARLNPEYSSQEILQAEGAAMPANIGVSQPFAGDTGGPYEMILEIPKSQLDTYRISGNRYELFDSNVIFGFDYWYYVAAYDEGDASVADWNGTALPNGIPSLESYRTMNYPPNEVGTPSSPPKITVNPGPFASAQFESEQTVVPVPNPWRADGPKSTVLFTGLPQRATIKIFDVTGNLVQTLEHNSNLVGTEEWNLISRTQNQIVAGIYYYRVEDLSNGAVQFGKLMVIR
ncbi:MAG: T9SS type A sorting domain-containing protein [bacterium]